MGAGPFECATQCFSVRFGECCITCPSHRIGKRDGYRDHRRKPEDAARPAKTVNQTGRGQAERELSCRSTSSDNTEP